MTHAFAVRVYTLYLSRWGADEVDFLSNMNTLVLQLLPNSPHVGTAQILVLKHNFDILCVHIRAFNLCATFKYYISNRIKNM